MIMMKTLMAILVLLVATSASAQTRETQEKRLNEYLPYAGEPVDRFQFWNLQRWELVGEYKVIVWPQLNKAYLLTVYPPCNRLEWTQAIGVTSTAQVVSQKFDSVVIGEDKCRIKEIRPIDYKKYLSDRKAAKDGGKS
jgi:type II secretory pathway pseudopilin PulG